MTMIDLGFLVGFLLSAVICGLTFLVYHLGNPLLLERRKRSSNSGRSHGFVAQSSLEKETSVDHFTQKEKRVKKEEIENVRQMRTVHSQFHSLMVEKPEDGIKEMTEEEIVLLLDRGKLRPHQLEKDLGNELKAVHIRRNWISKKAQWNQELKKLPYFNYDYSFVSNSCCENVLGYVPLPVGYAGPLKINGKTFYVPMATTEGCLVASTSRGCSAIQSGDGVKASVKDLGMTRGPVVLFPRAEDALKAKCWFDRTETNYFRFVKQKFDSTSRFASLKEVKCNVAGRLLFMRFLATTGDAMGMNMVSKATDAALRYVRDQYFPEMRVISLSGNFCVDKKSAAVNWIEGRGKLVVCDAVIPSKAVKTILKTDVETMVELNLSKNMIGSAISGALGGFNAHSANIVTAIFLATGQDAAQTVSSSNCMTQIEKWGETGEDLYISVTLPSLEVGSIGGGTILPPQRACLEMLGVSGAGEVPGENSAQLARIIGATVLAGELSLLAALTSGDLVKSHIRHNRSSINLKSASMAQLNRSQSGNNLEDLGRQINETVGIHPQTCSKVLT